MNQFLNQVAQKNGYRHITVKNFSSLGKLSGENTIWLDQKDSEFVKRKVLNSTLIDFPQVYPMLDKIQKFQNLSNRISKISDELREITDELNPYKFKPEKLNRIKKFSNIVNVIR